MRKKERKKGKVSGKKLKYAAKMLLANSIMTEKSSNSV